MQNKHFFFSFWCTCACGFQSYLPGQMGLCLAPTVCEMPTGHWGFIINIDHEENNEIATKISTTRHNMDQNIGHKTSLKSVYLQTLQILRQNCVCSVHYGKTVLYPISQQIHVKQDAGGYFYISSFNGRVIHFQVLRYFI